MLVLAENLAADAVYGPTDAVYSRLYMHDLANALYDVAASGLQLVPIQPLQEQGSPNALTPRRVAAQDSSGFTAQLSAQQQQQHDHKLATMHQQEVQQLA